MAPRAIKNETAVAETQARRDRPFLPFFSSVLPRYRWNTFMGLRTGQLPSPITRLPNHTILSAAYPFSTGCCGSLDHSDHDPAYSFAPVNPACSNASKLWQAVTPEPQ